MKKDDEKHNDEWKSCCITMDRRAVQYFTQIFIICGIMIFNIYQLLNIIECPSQVQYMSLLTFLIGILIPNPKFNK